MYMITQELVLFIKQQLQEGKSKEQIAQTLVPHGWQLEDINAVFTQIMPSAQPVQQSVVTPEVRQTVIQPTEPVQTNQVAQSNMNTTGGASSSFKNPTGILAGAGLVIAAIATTLITFYVQTHQVNAKALSMLANQNTVIAGILGVMIIGLIVSGFITKLVARILSIEPRTYAKSALFASFLTVITSIITLVTLAGVPIYIVPIAGIIIWVVFFWYYFETSVVKAIGAFLLNTLVGAVIAGILFFISIVAGVGLLTNINHLFTKGSVENRTPNPVMPSNQEVVPVVPSPQEGDSSSPNPIGEPSTSTNMVEATNTSTVSTTVPVSINPELSHVKDAFPVAFPLPNDDEVITATVLSATNFEGIRYILDYTSTHSLAYLRNAMKSSLEKAGYIVSINETNQDYRVITASKVVRNTARTFKIIIEKTVLGATISIVFTQ